MQRLNAPTFFDHAIPLAGNQALLRNVALVILGSILLAISAQTKFPIGPVPVTLQTLVLMVMGATYGWRLAGLTVLTYFAYGIAGLPVFALPPYTGYLYLAGGSHTAGFLWGFLIGAMFIGAAAQWGMARNPIMLAGAMLMAHILIYIPGLAWAMTFIGTFDWLANTDDLFNVYLNPFVVGDTLKILIAVALVPAAYKAVETLRKG